MTLDGVATDVDGQTRKQAGEATEVAGTVRAIAEGDVFDLAGLDARLVDGALNGVCRH